ncbi:hypothetical protein [Pontiella sp.]|uniref:hypothetical protein n=1 Tax=Pontiella sp. TaxID=2837462 RepID=UPI003564C82B
MKPLKCGIFWGALFAVSAVLSAEGLVDAIEFGDAASEQAHRIQPVLSEVFDGALNLNARRLLPEKEANWRGGKLTFNMKVDPAKPNYFTVKFWGNDTCGEQQHEARLCLYIEGKQLGTRHLGMIDMLDIMQAGKVRYPGRFLYTTRPLPIHMTQGKSEVEITIEGQGGINGYASKIEDYQKSMTEPSRGIYRAYVHTNPCFEPPETEVQGAPPAHLPLRPASGSELIDRLKTELNELSEREMARSGKKHELNIQYLARAYTTPWNAAYKNPKALERIVDAIDIHGLDYQKTGKVTGKRWFFLGPIGDAIRLTADDLTPWLNEKVPETQTVRRTLWADLMVASRNHNSSVAGEARRSLSNQCMIKDLNTYYCNLALRRIEPSKAWPEENARRMLYEAVGLEPFSGSWDENGHPDWSKGKNHMLLTEQGLTREFGYVGGYGEIISESGLGIYEATKPAPDQEGDPRIKAQLIKMIRARAPFRYPLVDKEGYRSMNLETLIGWRDWKYPGDVIYDQYNGRDSGPFDVAVATGDPVLLGYGQQMLEDRQYFAALKERMEDSRINYKTYLLSVPETYEKNTKLPQLPHRLPMSEGQPDFVFSDPGDGVLAFKDGGNIFYASLYWRSRRCINNLARVHYMTPQLERDSIVNIKTRFKDSGNVFTYPERTNLLFSRGRAEKWYTNQGIYQAMTGVEFPIAEVTGVDSYEIGDEHLQAGKGQLYQMEYGPYFIAMNCDETETFRVELPAAFVGAKELVSGQWAASSLANLKPGRTIVLRRDLKREP